MFEVNKYFHQWGHASQLQLLLLDLQLNKKDPSVIFENCYLLLPFSSKKNWS